MQVVNVNLQHIYNYNYFAIISMNYILMCNCIFEHLLLHFLPYLLISQLFKIIYKPFNSVLILVLLTFNKYEYFF